MEGRPAFRAAILEQTAPVRPHRIAAEVVAAAADLHVRHPQIRALLVECTNLPPYRRAIARATGLPVFDALTLCDGLMGRPYPWERARSAHRDP